MIATPCIIPVPNPPPGLDVIWQQRATSWEARWNLAYNSRDVHARVVFKSVYCRSAYAHLIARALGGR